MKNTDKELHAAIDTYTETENAISELETVPDLLQTVIDHFNLERSELSEADAYNLVDQHTRLYNLLYLAQRTIDDSLTRLRSASPTKEA